MSKPISYSDAEAIIYSLAIELLKVRMTNEGGDLQFEIQNCDDEPDCPYIILSLEDEIPVFYLSGFESATEVVISNCSGNKDAVEFRVYYQPEKKK